MLQIQTDQECKETEDLMSTLLPGHLLICLQQHTLQRDTNAHQYSVYFADHNAGGIRINSNHNNADSSTTDNGRAASAFTIIEFDSGVI